MRASSRHRRRLFVFIALAAFGIAGAFAVADSLTLIGPRTVEPHGEVSPPIEDATDGPGSPTHDERGARASSQDPRAGNAKKSDREKRRGRDDGDGEQAETVAALIPAGSGGGSGLAPPCTDTVSCVGHLERLIPDVRKRIPDLPTIRECTSSIGGEALCFDFGGGKYLVGDAPDDGEAEFGFCSSSGYYYVSGPSLDGGAGSACPDDPAREEGSGGGDPPTPRDCTSAAGGEATCFDFGDGKYIVSDPLADGDGELGFCTGSGYYYVSAPSAEGHAGAECPDAPTAD